uniref:CNH domain-containing protein n=1 Tax=Elaeophora elaphi TaxID=1147741 RepID=A0A0R3RYF8_9BILA
MGTITAMIIVCCLIISAALTVVIILVTIPTEITRQSHHPELWMKRENTSHGTPVINYFYFHQNKKVPHSSKSDVSRNSEVIVSTTTATVTIISVTNATTITKVASNTTTTAFPDATEIAKLMSDNDKPSNQPLTTVPVKMWKANKNRSSQGHTTVLLSTNITITREKKVTSSNRRSAIESRQHHSASQESTPRNSRRNLTTLMLHQHIEQLPLSDDYLEKSEQEKEQATQMMLLREVMFPNDVKVIGLAMQHGVLYVATNDGRIVVINPETSEQVLYSNTVLFEEKNSTKCERVIALLKKWKCEDSDFRQIF